jgi:serine/threonine protein kinase
VLELCPNGELLGQLKKVGSFDVNVAAFYAGEIVLALEYLHANGIIHRYFYLILSLLTQVKRDLKPENVLLDEHMHVKLTDFGTSKIIGTEKNGKQHKIEFLILQARSNSFVGTAEYVSPELLNEKITNKRYAV